MDLTIKPEKKLSKIFLNILSYIIIQKECILHLDIFLPSNLKYIIHKIIFTLCLIKLDNSNIEKIGDRIIKV